VFGAGWHCSSLGTRNYREPKLAIKIEPVGNDFLLTRRDTGGNETVITLSEADILSLALSAQALQLEILRRRDPRSEGPLAVPAAELVHIELHHESLGESLLMTAVDKNGNRLTYAMPLQLAQNLLARLPAFVARLMTARPTQQ
jgi:hypothetical protein